MTCPHCAAPQSDPPSRFCDACGLALPVVRRAAAPAATAGEEEVRCPECGLVARARRCRGCGAPVRWPEHLVPPDELGREGG